VVRCGTVSRWMSVVQELYGGSISHKSAMGKAIRMSYLRCTDQLFPCLRPSVPDVPRWCNLLFDLFRLALIGESFRSPLISKTDYSP